MRFLRLFSASLFGLLSLIVVMPGAVSAHPLDEYLQASYITLATDRIAVEIDLSIGLLVAPSILALIDTNQDSQISEAEGQSYANLVLGELILQVDSQPQSLTLTNVQFPPYLNLSAGGGIIRLDVISSILNTPFGKHVVYFENKHQPVKSSYLANAFIQKDNPITIGGQNRDSIQQSVTISYSNNTSNASPASTPEISTNVSLVTQPPTSSSVQQQQLIGYLSDPELSPWLVVIAIGLSLLLGGLHALTPGHGKTLLAAYLVGSHGTSRHAFILAGIITFTHTISVIVVGLLALLASQYLVPGLLVPLLEIGAGVLVVSLGTRLIWARWHGVRPDKTVHHAHSHSHSVQLPKQVKFSNLLTMGISGGLIPCPEALGILLIAIGLNRLVLGLALILAFSLGVGLVLVMLGLLLVRSKNLFRGWSKPGSWWQKWLPLVSAIVVAVLGLGMVFKGLSAFSLLDGFLVGSGLLMMAVIVQYGYKFIISAKTTPKQRVATFPQEIPTPTSPLLSPAERKISNAPMSSAPMRYDEAGKVAWDEMWTDFCDLALEGGPPHRGTLLESVSAHASPDSYMQVMDELERGLHLVTGLEVLRRAPAGWIGIVATDVAMATWLCQAILVENVMVRRDEKVLYLPASAEFTLEKEIKNIITVVAKTHHYWVAHYNFQTSLV